MQQIIDFLQANLALVIAIAAVIVLLVAVLITAAVIKKRKRGESEQEDETSVLKEQLPADEQPKEITAENAENVEDSSTVAEPEAAAAEQTKEEATEPSEERQMKQEKTTKAATEKAPAEKKKSSGKWAIKHKGNNEYMAYLLASNGEVLLTSEVYTTIEGAKTGIETIKKNIALDNFEVVRDKAGRFFYKLKTTANRLLCVGEVYASRQSCNSAIESVKRFAPSAILIDKIEEDLTVIDYKPNKNIDEKTTYKGKWKIIEDDEGYFCPQLYASNGELLLAGECVKSYAAAKSSMLNIRKNALEERFVIDKDKSGKYVFKLRNAQKSILCLSASYETLAACQKALDSTYRFCVTATYENL